jgi:TRAP-type C4-dicarboxylate transport system substrate-binding protein
MLTNLEPHGVVGLGYTFAGMQHVLSVAPVNSPGDLTNKKIRTFPSPIFNDWWHVLGAAPTALPLAEIAPSLTTNLLDAAAVDLDIIVGLKYHQQANYLALTNHMAFPSVVFTCKKWWESLQDEEREMVSKAFHEAEEYGIAIQIKAEVSNLEKLAKDGAEVNHIDLAPFKAKANQLYDKYTAQNDLIQRFADEVKAGRK